MSSRLLAIDVAQGERSTSLDSVGLFVFALVVRLALLPFASQDTNDHALRVWIAWRWAEDPFFFLHGHWPPLHFFVLGTFLRVFHDPIVTPVLVQVAFGALVPAVLYRFSLREWGDRWAALAVGAAYALYPVAIRTSLEVLAQPLFGLCLALGFVALSRAREPGAGWRRAAVAGAVLGVACLLRVEGWLLIPFFALTLWPRRKLIVVCGAVAALVPVLMMLANTLHYGNPLLPFTTVVDFELNMAGRDNFTLLQHAEQVARYVWLVVGGMTPLLALGCGLGALGCLRRRERQAIWLLPALAMSAILLGSVAVGSTAPKMIYTEIVGLLLIPFLASFLRAPEFRRLSTTWARGGLAALFGSMLVLLGVGLLRDLPGLRQHSRLVAAIPAVNGAPNFPGQPTIDPLVPLVRAQDGPGRGLIIDTLGPPASYYLGWQSRFHPDRIYIPPVAPNADLDEAVPAARQPLRERLQPLQDSQPLILDDFLHAYCTGLLLLQPGSRFAGWLNYDGASGANLHGIGLELQEMARAPWPLPEDGRLRAPGVAATAPGELVLFRYTVPGCAAGG